MVDSGIDSTNKVLPILVDSSGRTYVILSDGTENISIDANNLLETSVKSLKPDGTNAMPSMDTVGRAGMQYITNGTYTAPFDADDDAIAGGSNTILVICLNYVWDGAKWVRMTQP